MTAGGNGRGRTRAERLEWAAAAVAAAVVLGLAGLLLREGLTASDALPDLRVTLAAPLETPGGHAHLRFTLSNGGGRAASAVGVALRLRDGAAGVERRRVTIDYVPAHSQVTGGFFLDRPAAGLDAEAIVEGYVDP